MYQTQTLSMHYVARICSRLALGSNYTHLESLCFCGCNTGSLAASMGCVQEKHQDSCKSIRQIAEVVPDVMYVCVFTQYEQEQIVQFEDFV